MYLFLQVVVLISLFLQFVSDVLQLYIGLTPVMVNRLLSDHLTDRQVDARIYCRK